MPAKNRKLPNVNHMFLNRMGLKYMPCQEFIDKFKEYFLTEVHKNKKHKDMTIDNEKAIYFIVCILEAITYCLDFGFNVHLHRVMLFNARVSDYIHNVKRHKCYVKENIKKITFIPITSLYNNIRRIVNKDNKEYYEYIEGKEKRFKEIQDYYKEFYGKEDEWWTDNQR